ncbi:MAG: hypothetical protein JSR46_00130 [Verrucomicrobia bacterium]|nr:hypothetical protein [Verrucomicrobiota bacterium]
MHPDYVIAKPPLYIIPIVHYNMEVAAEVRRAFLKLNPDCVAVELPETLQGSFLHAASRLPDISVITATSPTERLCFPVEPCDASFEALRSAQERQIPAFCIDLDIEGYPKLSEPLPDRYSIARIGLKNYYEAYEGCLRPDPPIRSEHDRKRELHIARRLRELSFSYDKILVCIGMAHVRQVLTHLKDSSYPTFLPAVRDEVTICTYTEERVREVMAEYGWISLSYEHWRDGFLPESSRLPDRKQLIWDLLKQAQVPYEQASYSTLSPQSLATIFKFAGKWARIRDSLLPDLFQLIGAAKGCVDHNFAYEVWKRATEYPYYKNVDSLPELDLSVEEIWGGQKKIHFHLKSPSDKGLFYRRLRKDSSAIRLYPPNPFGICSYPPEDSVIEKFGLFLKKKGTQLQQEEGARTIPFSTSLEDGLDMKETIRHWPEKKLYVKAKGKPPGLVGSCVVIFDEEDIPASVEKFPCRMTWLGEHEQESDMAFYSTSMADMIVGPGIVRCTFGGFFLSYPAQRLFDVWSDPDYGEFDRKQDILLAAACDYSTRPVIVYAGLHPPSAQIKQRASRQGKRILFIPLTQFSKKVVSKLRTFHILDGREKRKIADEYIY